MKTKIKFAVGVISFILIAFCIINLTSCKKDDCTHQWGEWTTVTSATCTSSGTKERTCAECGAVEKEDISPLGHDFADATCQAPKTCKTCLATEGEALGYHTYDVNIVKDEAIKSRGTCTSAAVYYKSCSCGIISTEDTDVFSDGTPTGHQDKEKDLDHKCDLCGEDNVTEHQYSVTSCANAATCYECGETSGDAMAHIFDQTIICEETKKSEATCQGSAVYYKSCICGKISQNEDEVFVFGEAAPHVYDKEVVTPDALANNATCQCAATYYKSCVCGEISTNPIDVFESGELNNHLFNLKIVNESSQKSEVSCKSAATYHLSCSCGAVSTSEDETFTVGSPLPHTYTLTSEENATCQAPKTRTFTCPCGDTYTENIGDALGHIISYENPALVQVSGCEYVITYQCHRPGCDVSAQGEIIYCHDYVSSITTPVTCLHNGEMTLLCSCGNSKTKVIEKNPGAHYWILGEVHEGMRVDTCLICHQNKTVLIYEGTSTGNVNSANLKDREIRLGNAIISFNDAAISAFGSKNISLSINVLEGDHRKEVGVPEEMLSPIGENPVYTLTIMSGADVIEYLGESGIVTISIPYHIAKGENVDCIGLWFINKKGDTQLAEATYNRETVTFTLNVATSFAIAYLSPDESCALSSHEYELYKVGGGCTKDSYDLYLCSRCHKTYADEDSYVEAPGHDYATEVHPALCHEDGYTLYTCKICNHSYSTKIASMGHKWKTLETVDATCEKAGTVRYACEICKSEYTITENKAPHAYKDEVNSPTCSEMGYTVHRCEVCGYSYTDTFVNALNHSYEADGWTWSEDLKSATVTLVCKNDESHKITIDAVVGIKRTYGTCSDFTKTVYIASISYEGAIFCNERSTEESSPNHKFTTGWMTDDEEHWKECFCGEKTDVGAHVFEVVKEIKSPTCDEAGEMQYLCICGMEKREKIPANGHNFIDGVCTECHAGSGGVYYVNLAKSIRELDGFSISINDLTFEIKEKNGDFSTSYKLFKNIEKIHISYLEIFVLKEEVSGSAQGEISFSGGVFGNSTYDFSAVFYGGSVYLEISRPGEPENSFGAKLSLEAIEKTLESEPFDSSIFTAFSTIEKAVSPVFDYFAKGVTEVDNTILSTIFGMAFNFSQEKNGTCFAILDNSKLKALEENLQAKSAMDLILTYFDETYAERIISMIVELETPLGDTADNVRESLRENTAYRLIEICTGICAWEDTEDFISDITNCISFTINTNYLGNITEVSTDIENISLHNSRFIASLTLASKIESNKTIIDNSSDIPEKIDESIILPSAPAGDDNQVSFSEYHSGCVSYLGEEYNYSDGFRVTLKKAINTDPSWIVFRNDCSQSTYYYSCVREKTHRFIIATITVDGEKATLLIDLYGEKQIRLVENALGYTAVFDDGKMVEVEFDHSMADASKADKAAEYGKLYLAIFGDEGGKITYFGKAEEYYYNKTSSEFSDKSFHEFEHSCDFHGEGCLVGYTVLSTCKACGITRSEEKQGCEDKNNISVDLSALGACDGVITADVCLLCGYGSGISLMDLGCIMGNETAEDIKDENGKTVGQKWTSSCTKCDLKLVKKVWTEELSPCTAIEYEVGYVFIGEAVILSYVKGNPTISHSYTYEFILSGDSCESGYRVITTCRECDIRFEAISNRHDLYEIERTDLSKEGACYGEFIYRSCPCGKEQTTDLTSCIESFNSEKYYDDDGRLVLETAGTCHVCNFSFTTLYYCEKAESSCTLIHHYTKAIGIGVENISIVKYEIREASHDLKTTASLAGGVSASCNEGVTVTKECQVCGYETITTHYTHEVFEIDRIYLGKCCDTAENLATVYSCACGAHGSVIFSNTGCHLEAEKCRIWIDGILTKEQQGMETICPQNTSYVYTCKNENCSLKIRYARYWVKDSDGCVAVEYECWQFGYEDDGSYLRQITVKTGRTMPYHNYVDESHGGNVSLECTDCGSYYREIYTYDNENSLVKSEIAILNRADSTKDRYRNTVIEYRKDPDGLTYISREYEKIVFANGDEFSSESLKNILEYTGSFGSNGCMVLSSYSDSDGVNFGEEYAFVIHHGYEYRIYTKITDGENWERYHYTYTFDNGCKQTEIYTSKNGDKREVYRTVCNFDDIKATKAPTCTQTGSGFYECTVCKKIGEALTIAPEGHEWEKIADNFYFCPLCELESQSNEQGEVVLEDLTPRYGGNSNYVVGYLVRADKSFAPKISLILPDGEIIDVTDVEITQLADVCGFSFRKEDICDFAFQNGYDDYKIRFSLLYAGDNSEEHHILLSGKDVGVIVRDITFRAHVGANEACSFTLMPQNGGTWEFTSYTDFDTEAELYDDEGNLLASDDDGGNNTNFKITYELEAGKVYTVKVRWHYAYKYGNMALSFSQVPKSE